VPAAIRAAAIAVVALAVLAPAGAAGHPLGNFTINHHAGLRVAPDAIWLDVVVDVAEIPAVEQRARLDRDGDGAVSVAETEVARLAACAGLASELDLRLDDRAQPLRPVAAGLSFPAGAADLATIRTVCLYRADVAITAPATVTFTDRSSPGRPGWREIVAAGDRVALGADAPAAASTSDRLRRYPDGLLAAPLAMASAAFSVTPGGDPLPPLEIPDARLLPGVATPVGVVLAAGEAVPGAMALDAVVPGGVGSDVAALVAVGDLDPVAIVGSLLLAIALGALHGLSPGHGKTIIAAYLVGSRGTARQAIGLGLAVTASHTVGVLVLAVLATAFAGILPPDRLVPVLIVGSGVLFVALGVGLLVTQARAWRRRRATRIEHERAHATGAHHAHDHAPDHGADGQDRDHALEHRHLGIRHRHAPPTDGGLGLRGLVALGVAGGLVPSVSALVLLLGSIAAGRPAYGIVLIVAFGLGMAAVLVGVGLVFVRARTWLGRFEGTGRLGPALEALPIAAAIVVVAAGLWVTAQALGVAA
jgi:ABC-type nickel/cobalt efflux system permease component RcnA